MKSEILFSAFQTVLILFLLLYIVYLKERVKSAYNEAKEICAFINYRKDLQSDKPLTVWDGSVWEIDVDETRWDYLRMKKWIVPYKGEE